MAGYNSSQWSGNFIAAGVTMISADFENLGSTQLAMRLVFFDPSLSTQWESNAVYLLNPNSGWQHASFAIDQADFTQVEGSTSFSDTLSQVNRMMFRHNPNLDSGGVSIVGTLGIDNVHAGVVPEPASLAVLSLGVLAILRKRKQSR